MDEIREIVTKAVVAKGKKTIRIKDSIIPKAGLFSVLGCWIINHDFHGELIDKNKVRVEGTAEIDVWASFNDNTSTDVVKKTIHYEETIKTRQLVKELCGDELNALVRVTNQPTCTNVCIQDDEIIVDVVFELVAEIIGETKVFVPVCNSVNETIEDNFENEINEDFIREQ